MATDLPINALNPAAAAMQSPAPLPRAGQAASARQNLPVTENFAAGDKPAAKFELQEAVQRLNQQLQSFKRDLQFSIDDASGRTIIKVFDTETKELIRQIPPEELLSIAENLARTSELNIFDGKV